MVHISATEFAIGVPVAKIRPRPPFFFCIHCDLTNMSIALADAEPDKPDTPFSLEAKNRFL